jgi:hypothetical protein
VDRFRQQTLNQAASGFDNFADGMVYVGHIRRYGTQRILFTQWQEFDTKQSPTEPIEGRTPASRQRWPKARELYWLPSHSASLRG